MKTIFIITFDNIFGIVVTILGIIIAIFVYRRDEKERKEKEQRRRENR